MDLGCGLDEVLEVGAEEEVSEVDEFAVVLVLDVDDTPAVLAATDLLAVDNDALFGTDDGEGDKALFYVSHCLLPPHKQLAHLDLLVERALLLIKLVVVVGVHLEVVEGKLLLDALLEGLAFFQRKGVRLGDHGHHVDDVGQLLEDDNVDGLEGVAGGLDEEEAAVDAGILDVALTLGSEFLAEVGGVLVFDVLDDGVPAAVVVDHVAVSGGIDNVEAETNAILLDDVGNGLDLGGGSDGLVGLEATLGVDEVGSEDGVDERRLAEAGLTCRRRIVSWALMAMIRTENNNIPTQMTLNWKPRLSNLRSIWEVMLSKPTWVSGWTVAGPMVDMMIA